MTKKKIIVFSIILLVVLFLATLPTLSKSYFIYNHKESVDITSGKIKIEKNLFQIPIYIRVKETSVSKLLKNASKPKWRIANSFGLFAKNSPHYDYHSAIAQIIELEAIWDFHNFSHERKVSSAKKLIEIWELEKGYFPAKIYLRDISHE